MSCQRFRKSHYQLYLEWLCMQMKFLKVTKKENYWSLFMSFAQKSLPKLVSKDWFSIYTQEALGRVEFKMGFYCLNFKFWLGFYSDFHQVGVVFKSGSLFKPIRYVIKSGRDWKIMKLHCSIHLCIQYSANVIKNIVIEKEFGIQFASNKLKLC